MAPRLLDTPVHSATVNWIHFISLMHERRSLIHPLPTYPQPYNTAVSLSGWLWHSAEYAVAMVRLYTCVCMYVCAYLLCTLMVNLLGILSNYSFIRWLSGVVSFWQPQVNKTHLGVQMFLGITWIIN